MPKRALLLLVALLPLACTTSKPLAPAAELKAIADEVWARELEQNIPARTKLGLPIERMPDPSYDEAARDAAFAQTILARLNRIDPTALSEDDRLTRDILRWQQQLAIDGLPHFWQRFQITPYASPIRTVNQVFTEFELKTPEDRERYLRLLADYARFIDALGTVVKEQQRRGILIPKPELPLVRGMFAALLREPDRSMFRVSDPALSPAVSKAIESTVNPALQRLLDILSPEYEQAAPSAVGLSQYPGGAAAYRYLMRLRTSLDLSPEEVHRLGLSEIERIERELDAIRQEVGFTGDRGEFHRFLRTDARFFAGSPEEIERRLAAHVRNIEPHIDRFFARTPRAPYDVRRLDPALEGAMTFGYYDRPTPADPIGHYYFNGSKPNERNLLFGAALMAHELVPGHHFQIARQEENESLHAIRRGTYDTAFVEGWGEYAAALGKDMGAYTDPYDRAGRLMMDKMLSARLVVDSGMNALGWPRERAMQFLRDNSMMSETELATETLRYSTDIPAQALAYKIGSLKMLELRARAQKALGPRFDIREFHEWIIGSGSMPLALLEQRVDEKIRQAR